LQELRNVREQVRSGFDSTTLDNKVHVSFGCAPALQTLDDSKVALESVAQQVMFGLITLKRAQATPAAAPSTSAARRAGKQPAAAASKPKASTGGSTAGGRPFLKIEENGNEILTALFKYDKADVEKAYDRPLSDICMHVLLREDGKDSDCPHRDKPGHESGGKCHDPNGVNTQPEGHPAQVPSPGL
jgi:hypothetical protein